MTTTVGLTTHASTVNAPAANTTVLSQFTAGANANINRGFVYGTGTVDSTTKFKVVIYSDNGSNLPNALLATSDEYVGWTNGSWMSVVFQTPLAVTNGTKYWIGHIIDTQKNHGCEVNAGYTYKYKSTTYSSGPVTPFSSPSNGTLYQWSVYVDDGGPVLTGKPIMCACT